MIDMVTQKANESDEVMQPVSRGELNEWRRGFTPQAEIWNGRMAMFAILVIFSASSLLNLLLSN